jgi:hypothetical protein
MAHPQVVPLGFVKYNIARGYDTGPFHPRWSLLKLRMALFGPMENLFLGIANAELRLITC